jgi:hypothetical protein
VSESSIEVESSRDRASLTARHLAIHDYGNITNAVVDGPSTVSVVSFDIDWAGLINRVPIDTSNNRGFGGSGWGGTFSVVNATAEWSASQPGFTFRSDPASTSQPVFAIVGRERSGVFFG